jgi:hypothetical protein
MQYNTKDKTKAKLQRKAKLEYNSQSSPPLKRKTNSKLPSQASKLGLVKWFGEVSVSWFWVSMWCRLISPFS